jgi:hypothetical protein
MAAPKIRAVMSKNLNQVDVGGPESKSWLERGFSSPAIRQRSLRLP